MKPLSELDPSGVRAVLVDIDETLTTDGKLTAQAYGALERLSRAGLRVIPVTGRPAGWCDHIARMWPVEAVVGENGAFYFSHAGKRLHKRFHDDAGTRAQKRKRLDAVAAQILASVPGCALASDQPYHVNGWFGEYDKLAMTRRLFAERFGLDLDAANSEVVFAGDSPNDSPMFGFFRNSVGVANVRRFEHFLPEKPKYVTLRDAGAGFAELADHLLRR